MKPFIKTLVSILLVTFYTSISIAQPDENTLETPSTFNLVKSTHGFIVYEISKKNLVISFHDNETAFIKTISQPLSKKPDPLDLSVLSMGKGYRFVSRYFSLLISFEGAILEFNEWTRNDIYQYSPGDKLEEYIPDYRQGSQSNIYLEKHLVEFIFPTKSLLFKNRYKGKPTVRIFFKNKSKGLITFRKTWEAELDHEKITNHIWYDLKGKGLFLYVIAKEDKERVPYLYKINVEEQKLGFKIKLNTELDDHFALSNMVVNENNEIVVFGNYQQRNSTRKENLKYYIAKKTSYDFNIGFDGWRIIKLNNRGDVLKTKSQAYTINLPTKHSGKPFDEKDFMRTYVGFKAIRFTKEGKIQVLVSNTRLYTDTQSYTDKNGRHSSISVQINQNYGFTYLTLDEDFNVLQSDFREAIYTNALHNKGEGLYANPAHMLYRPNYQKTLFYTIGYGTGPKSNIWTIFFEKETCHVLYYQRENEGLHYYLMTLGKNGTNSKKNISVIKKRDNLLYHLNSPNDLVEFKWDKKSYSLKKVKVTP